MRVSGRFLSPRETSYKQRETASMAKARDQMREQWLQDSKHAKQTLLSDGEVVPMFVIRAREGAVVPVLAQFGNNEQKAATLELIRLLCIAMDAASISCMMEAWMVMDPVLSENMAPSKSPRRREVVIVSNVTVTL